MIITLIFSCEPPLCVHRVQILGIMPCCVTTPLEVIFIKHLFCFCTIFYKSAAIWIMYPSTTVDVADEVSMVVLYDQIVDFIALCPPMPVHLLDFERRSGACDDGVADSQPACRSKALAAHEEGMVSG